jgi:hypothetical protein
MHYRCWVQSMLTVPSTKLFQRVQFRAISTLTARERHKPAQVSSSAECVAAGQRHGLSWVNVVTLRQRPWTLGDQWTVTGRKQRTCHNSTLMETGAGTAVVSVL